MARLSKERKAEVEAAVKDRVYEAVLHMLRKGDNADISNMNIFAVDEISRYSGVSMGTIYNYFRDKADIITSALKRLCEKLDEKEAKIVNGSQPVPGKLLSIIELYMGADSETHKMMYLPFQSRMSIPFVKESYTALNERIQKRITQIVRQDENREYFRDIPVDDIVFHFMGILYALIRSRLNSGEEYYAEENQKTILEIFMSGVAGMSAEG